MNITDIPVSEPRFPDYYDLERPVLELKKSTYTKEEVKSMKDKETEDKLFCYKCNTHVKPHRKHGESSLYFDIDSLPIIDNLFYCPICEHEVYDRDYEMLVIMSKLMIINKRGRHNEVL